MKLIKILLCIFMILNLVGCSGNKPSDDTQSGNESNEGIKVNTGEDSTRIYNTVTNVKGTLPASLFEYADTEVTQEELDIRVVERKEPTLIDKFRRMIGLSKKSSVRTYQ